MIAECDVVDLQSVYSVNPQETLQRLTWTTRILPVQVLGRKATSTAYKYRSVERMLHLETGDAQLARLRTATFLGDMGTESKLPMMPDLSGVASDENLRTRAFPNTLPIHDVDHALHHIIEELRTSWNQEMFDLFDKQLNTLAKYFSKADNCARFRKHFIIDNPMVEGSARKKSIAKMFESSCPTFVKHRWEYRYEVLTWMTHRSAFLMWLDPSTIESSAGADDNFGDPDYSFSDAELRCLNLLFTDKIVTSCFWALAHAMLALCSWGHKFSVWMHGCWCHSTAEVACLSLLC